jgi:hypothetical protein
MLTPASAAFGAIAQFIRHRAAPPTSGAWPSINDPFAIPFFLYEPLTVFQLGWYNGSGTMTDAVDMGIFTSSWVRQISTTATTRVGASALQFVDVADTVLPASAFGTKYYLAMSNNGTTANQQMFWAMFANAPMLAMLGALDSATDAATLPDPLTNMAGAAVAVSVPVMVIAARALV